MSFSIIEQAEDLQGANLELDFAEPLHERGTESLEMFNEDDEPFVIRTISTKLLEALLIPASSRVLESMSDLLSPIGLKRLVLSKPAMLKKGVEPLLQPTIWCCPKFGLIILLYQKARAPPAFLLPLVKGSLNEHIFNKNPLKSITYNMFFGGYSTVECGV